VSSSFFSAGRLHLAKLTALRSYHEIPVYSAERRQMERSMSLTEAATSLGA